MEQTSTGGPDAAPLSYRAAGVDYEQLDRGKRDAVHQALATAGLMTARGGRANEQSRGAPAFVFDFAGRDLAFVVEGLGTKSLIARAVLEQTGHNGFADVAFDTVAAIVGDLICVGALPLVVNAYFASGSSRWYEAHERAAALLEGWRQGCEQAGCTWGGGESPALAGLVADAEIELAGSAVGALPEGIAPILGQRLAAGDEIVLVASNGLHANGASLARRVADALPEGYATPLPSGRPFGEALLDRSALYVRLVEELLAAGVVPTYISHITGHGFLKLMRPPAELHYRIERLPAVPEVLSALAAHAGLSARGAYMTFNMGAGLALYCAAGEGERAVALARSIGHEALLAGSVEPGRRSVTIEPLDVHYAGSELDLGGPA